MLTGKKIGFVGAGNMAEAMIKGLLGSGLVSVDSLFASEPRLERHKDISRYGISVLQNNVGLVKTVDIVVFAVKPQQMADVLRELSALSGQILSERLFVSIAAGLSIAYYEKYLGSSVRLVRVMPNMGAFVQASISAMAANRSATSTDLKLAEELLSSIGEVLVLPEDRLDAVTAVSGSGPAYFFYLMECVVRAAQEIGLDPALAGRLIKQTALGAAKLALESPEGPETLRRKVTSPGGTTEAALKVFEASSIKEGFVKGIRAAFDRSKEIREAQ